MLRQLFASSLAPKRTSRGVHLTSAIGTALLARVVIASPPPDWRRAHDERVNDASIDLALGVGALTGVYAIYHGYVWMRERRLRG